jgi:hypothetical protein
MLPNKFIDSNDFPQLTPHNHLVTSPATPDYNCIAWSAGTTERWWQPGVYWPADVPPNEYGIAVLVLALSTLGFEECADGNLEPGFEKVARYGSTLFYTHAARQLLNGKWTSKLGRSEDIQHHSPDDVAGGIYGEVVQFMRRPSAPSD